MDIHEKNGNEGTALAGFTAVLASVDNSRTFPGHSSQILWKTIPIKSLILKYLSMMKKSFVYNPRNRASIKIMDVENALFPVFLPSQV